MIQRGFIILLLVASLHLSEVSSTCYDSDGNCADCESWCSSPIFPLQCELTFFARFCSLSCNTCIPDACLERGCEHNCIPPETEDDTATCACLEGYILNEDGVSCDDVDECEDEDRCTLSDGTTRICVNVPGDYVCNNCEELGPNVFSYYGERQGCCRIDNLNTCGKSTTNLRDGEYDLRIVGGEDAPIQRWPWHAHIRIFEGLVVCNGVLIHEDWVLTLHECYSFLPILVGNFVDYIDVMLGASNVEDPYADSNVQIYSVQGYFQQNEDPISLVLLRLSESADTTGPWVNPICLPGGEQPSEGQTCYVTGFGITDPELVFEFAGFLQQVNQQVQSDETCLDYFEPLLPDMFKPDEHVCVGVESEDKGPCRGDEGSPLVCQRCDTCDWYVAGIGAFSAECAVAGAYNTYIEINAASEAWILGIISNGAASYIPEQCVRPYWGPWTPYTECPVTCGQGLRERTRQCVGGIPGFPDCFGSSRETAFCNLDPCVGVWSDWKNRGGCSEECGGGEQLQVRTCVGGTVCGEEGDLPVRTIPCGTEPCVGGIGPWGSWGSCTVTCGGGTQERRRYCFEPDGQCVEDRVEDRPCNTQDCLGCDLTDDGALSPQLCYDYICAVSKSLRDIICNAYIDAGNCRSVCCLILSNPEEACSDLR